MKRFEDDELVNIVEIDQDTDEWLEWRNKGIGSSDVALLMNPEPVFDRTVRTLWEQRVGYERAVKLDNEHIKRGKELEPIIRDKVIDLLQLDFKPACIERTDAPYLRASLDGINYEDNCILEIKAPAERYFNEYLSTWRIPENYYLQMQYQMLVANVDYGYFAFYNKDILNDEDEQQHAEPYIILVNSDIEKQIEIERACALFWRAVETKTPIGWSNNKLTLFDTRPTIYAVFADNEQFFKMTNTLLPARAWVGNEIKESCMVQVENEEELSIVKAYNPNCKIRIISFTDTTMAGTNHGKFSKKKLEELILADN